MTATSHGFGNQGLNEGLDVPEYVLQGPLLQNPIEQKIRQSRHKNLDPNNKKISTINQNNGLSDYFGNLAMQMRPERISEMRMRRQWRQDFMVNHYDPQQCW